MLQLATVTVNIPGKMLYIFGVCALITIAYSGEPGPGAFTSGEINGGKYICPYGNYGNCPNGHFKCKCPGDGEEVKWIIECAGFYACLPNGNLDCYQFDLCQTCYKDGSPCRSCIKGYHLVGSHCFKDYCESNNGGCSQLCHNTAGSHYCSCHKGFTLNKDKKTCDPTEELTCEKPDEICGGILTSSAPENPWHYGSYALYTCGLGCDDRKLTLDGAYAQHCKANSKGDLWWSEDTPLYACVDACLEVKAEDRRVCGIDIDSREQCDQLGCCFKDNKVAGVPKCYMNPMKTFVRYGKQQVSGVTASYPQVSVSGCAYKTLYKVQKTTFVIRHDGRHDSQNVSLQTCMLVDGTSMIPSENSDTYKLLMTVSKEETSKDIVIGLNIQSPDVTGFPTAMFLIYPHLKYIKAPRLVMKLVNPSVTQVEALSPIEMEGNETVSVSEGVMHVHSSHFNLDRLSHMAGANVKYFKVMAKTVIIGGNVDIPRSLEIEAQDIIIDHSQAEFIDISPDGSILNQF